ncbi:hypothetical protein PMG71_08645 [Roseofilum sp. BLCC_M154]|uniref:Transposase n=1 Tax=Roseofilum acuticapitatum BLCC-M154 TaxID=3022444 RepID=A0ABT7AT59_9CYAN|nr:hypothetical protein [Roseofilum acuticapitatum]MDJ1169491.1 hypothetical protein [Roseofilum acuticapitatum BLCC-M154]
MALLHPGKSSQIHNYSETDDLGKLDGLYRDPFPVPDFAAELEVTL